MKSEVQGDDEPYHETGTEARPRIRKDGHRWNGGDTYTQKLENGLVNVYTKKGGRTYGGWDVEYGVRDDITEVDGVEIIAPTTYDVPFKEAMDLMVYDGAIDDYHLFGTDQVLSTTWEGLQAIHDPDGDDIVKYPALDYERAHKKLEAEQHAYDAYNASGHAVPVYFELDLLLLLNGRIPKIGGASVRVIIPRSGPIIKSVGAASRSEMLARKLKMNLNSPTTRQVLNSLDYTVEAFISKFRKGSIRGKIPGEFMDKTVEEALKSGNSTIRKLLTDKRFVK